MQNLISTIIAMFDIEVDDADGEDALDDNTYVQQDFLRIPTVAIVNHIENQGSFSRDCYERLEEGDQQDVIKHIAMYARSLVCSLSRLSGTATIVRQRGMCRLSFLLSWSSYVIAPS